MKTLSFETPVVEIGPNDPVATNRAGFPETRPNSQTTGVANSARSTVTCTDGCSTFTPSKAKRP